MCKSQQTFLIASIEKKIDWIKRNSIRINQAKFMTENELFNKYIIGEFNFEPNKPEYSEEYAKIKKIAMEENHI